MFTGFFYYMRERELKVSVTEWLTLMEALQKGLSDSSLLRFYHLCRCICIKSEAQFDLYDQCFAEFFQGAEISTQVSDELLDWLSNPLTQPQLSPEELAALEKLDLEELRKKFEERMKEQHERHDGGNYWVGTGGRSPFGHSGVHPSGVRVGGAGGGRSAMQVATKRQFKNLRHDRVLDIRQISVALRQLRRLAREGRRDELDLDETIQQTAKNAGDLEIVFRPPRKNNVKLLLLMDVGGSMTTYTRLSELLFSAAHKASHFKAFKHYYFHNCPYETLYSDMERSQGESTQHILQQLDASWYCIIVGDAAMGPHELTSKGGSVDYFHYNEEPGIAWLQRIAKRLPKCVWINPDPKQYWSSTWSTVLIQEVFDMYPFTIDGLDHAISELRQKVA